TRAQQETVNAKLGAQYGAIFGAHALMLTDPTLTREVEALIREQRFAAEYAVSRVIRRYAKTLESIQGGYVASRVADLFDIELRELPAVTRDGVRINLHGNIEFPQECSHCLDRGAEGIGLYRTEFLYLGMKEDPTEADHLEAYLSVLKGMGPKMPVVIRTLDL